MSIVYVILYTFTAGFALVFEDNYGLNKGETGLCFSQSPREWYSPTFSSHSK
jgi:hypothetical protein